MAWQRPSNQLAITSENVIIVQQPSRPQDDPAPGAVAAERGLPGSLMPFARITRGVWLKAIMSYQGPQEESLRHVCHVLNAFMKDDGTDGCFPAVRTIAACIGVHHATVGRRLKQLATLGWVDIEYRTVQFGRKAGKYFPAMPMVQHVAPISLSNGASERTNPMDRTANGAPRSTNPIGALTSAIGARDPRIGASDPRIGAPGRDGLLLNLTEESGAPSPSPTATGSGAPDTNSEAAAAAREALRELGRKMRLGGKS